MEKINIAELLKDCPKGMELDCTVCENVYFGGIADNKKFPIRCLVEHPDGGYHVFNFTKHGCWLDMAFSKCVIFPKGKTTWEGFVPPCQFKDGDIVATTSGNWIGITEGGKNDCFIPTYCITNSNGVFEAYFGRKEIWSFNRLATEEEKQKLFQAIKDNGYKWNDETKTLEKLIEPKFKVGDKVRHKNNHNVRFTITNIEDDSYVCGANLIFCFDEQDNYELIPNKFDITNLKAFESRVLIRDYDNQIWIPTFWGKYLEDDSNCRYLTTNGCYKYCIPFEGNQHLLGTSDDCNDYYKTW